MSFNYDKARDRTLKQITKYGASGQVILKGSSGGFDNSGNATPDTPDTIINGIITPLVQYKTAEIDDKSIQVEDAWVYFHSDSEPLIDMQTTLNSKTFRIIDVIKLSSVDDINIFTKLQLRIGNG